MENKKKLEHLENLGADGRMMLKRIYGKYKEIRTLGKPRGRRVGDVKTDI
jgi:hypothetical protein